MWDVEEWARDGMGWDAVRERCVGSDECVGKRSTGTREKEVKDRGKVRCSRDILWGIGVDEGTRGREVHLMEDKNRRVWSV